MISIDDHSSSWNKRRKRRRIGLLSTAHDVSDGFADENDKKKDASAKCDPNEDEVYTTAAVSTTTSRRSLLKRMLMDGFGRHGDRVDDLCGLWYSLTVRNDHEYYTVHGTLRPPGTGTRRNNNSRSKRYNDDDDDND